MMDHVVAQGYSGFWGYIKFNAGHSICWQTCYLSGLPVTTQFGAIYQSAATIGNIAYPFQFVQTPVEVAIPGYGSNGYPSIVQTARNNVSKTGTYKLVGPIPQTVDCVLHVIVIGRWK